MAVSDFTTLDCPIQGAGVLALLFGAGKSAATTFGQRLVDLVTVVDRAGGHNGSNERVGDQLSTGSCNIIYELHPLVLGNDDVGIFISSIQRNAVAIPLTVTALE